MSPSLWPWAPDVPGGSRGIPRPDWIYSPTFSSQLPGIPVVKEVPLIRYPNQFNWLSRPDIWGFYGCVPTPSQVLGHRWLVEHRSTSNTGSALSSPWQYTYCACICKIRATPMPILKHCLKEARTYLSICEVTHSFWWVLELDWALLLKWEEQWKDLRWNNQAATKLPRTALGLCGEFGVVAKVGTANHMAAPELNTHF